MKRRGVLAAMLGGMAGCVGVGSQDGQEAPPSTTGGGSGTGSGAAEGSNIEVLGLETPSKSEIFTPITVTVRVKNTGGSKGWVAGGVDMDGSPTAATINAEVPAGETVKVEETLDFPIPNPALQDFPTGATFSFNGETSTTIFTVPKRGLGEWYDAPGGLAIRVHQMLVTDEVRAEGEMLRNRQTPRENWNFLLADVEVKSPNASTPQTPLPGEFYSVVNGNYAESSPMFDPYMYGQVEITEPVHEETLPRDTVGTDPIRGVIVIQTERVHDSKPVIGFEKSGTNGTEVPSGVRVYFSERYGD